MWLVIFKRMLRRLIRFGNLRVSLPDGTHLQLGDGSGTPVAVHLRDPSLPRKFILNPELAVGEAYMDGTMTIEGDDLHGLISIGIRNWSLGKGHGVESLMAPLMKPLKYRNSARMARRNAAHHYDLSGALYALFLDADRQYSCAYFRDASLSLEEAQSAKKQHIARKLCLHRPDLRVLDIGCGWGGMALTLARDFGARVVGITLSDEQRQVAQQRVAKAGLADRVEIRLQDFRAITERFDRVVSVGMFEHVGARYYRRFFQGVHDMLTDDGVALIHSIGNCSSPGRTSPWIAKYIFPGGYIPSLSEVSRAIEREQLFTTDIEVWRLHYAETLRHWYDRFMANIDRVREIYDERFCRMWRFYLVASELTFRLNWQVVFQIQLARRQDAVPLTRDYLYGQASP
ncbi:MAG: class I SAM-dependent methyltransferase [Rhodobacteraceae bacterium]|nr:class I SAM-dependent methyltransferase [Paracoccaceae bacterium]